MKSEIHEISNQLLRLTPDQQVDPKKVLAEFFATYHLKDVRELMWEWLCSGLSHGGTWFPEGIDRSNLIFLYENLEKLAEASYLLHRKATLKSQSKRKSKTTKKNSHVNKKKKSTH